MALMSRFATTALVCSMVAATACAGDAPPPAEPAIEIGRISNNEFVTYQEGGDVTALTSLQVGVWLMPSLRYQGMVGTPDIGCIVIDLDRDQVFAEARGFIVSFDRGDGWKTITPYRMEVILPDPARDDREELLDYAGDRALLECTAVDELGVMRIASHGMTIAVN